MAMLAVTVKLCIELQKSISYAYMHSYQLVDAQIQEK